MEGLVWLVLKVLLLVAALAVVAFPLWWAWLEARDHVNRRRPPMTS